MKLLENKGFMQKMIIILVIFLLTNFIVPNYSRAGVSEVLIDPVITLVLWLGDGCFEILQSTFMGEKATIENYDDYVKSLGEGGNLAEKVASGWSSFLTKIPLVGGVIKNAQQGWDTIINGDSGYTGPIVLVKYSIASIVSNDIPAFDINFFNPNDKTIKKYENQTAAEAEIFALKTKLLIDDEAISDGTDRVLTNEERTEIENRLKEIESSATEKHTSSAAILQKTIRQWYSALRNIAIVALLSILVYMGIKILLSSSLEEKAKYKSNIINWIVALAILFSLHYIMSLSLYIVELITDAFEVNILSTEGYDTIIPTIRTMAEMGEFKERLGYTIMYAVIVVYTLMFTFTYLKRVVFMAFLTMAAPLVAVTYPIDKEKDGKSQAFDFWMKEYFFNLIMQPIHLLLYYIFITSAIDLVESNIIYALVAIGFIIPAEKLIRKMFNIEKAGNDSALGAGGFFEGAMVASMLGGLQRLGKGQNKGSGKDAKEDDENKDNEIRTTDPFELDDSNFQNQELAGDNGLDEVGQLWQDYIDAHNDENNAGSMTFNQGSNTTNINDNSRNQIDNNIKGAQRQRNLDITLDDDSSSARKDKKKSSKFIRGVAAVGRKKFNGKAIARALGATAKGVAHVGLGAAGATFGLAATVASGDIKNLDNFVVRGVGAGLGAATLGTAGIQGAINLGRGAKREGTDLLDTYRIGANSWTEKEYQDNVLIPRMKKKNDKDQNVKEKYRMEFGDTKLMSSSTRNEMYRYGVVNEDLIIKGLKEKNKNPGLSDKDLVRDAILASSVRNYKDIETIEKRIMKELELKGVFDNLEKRLEKKGEFDALNKKLEKKYKKIDEDNKLSVSEKETAKQELKQKEKDKIINKEKSKTISSQMKRIQRMSGID